ncbi:Ankyrin repeat domain-containing protein 50 [Daldinia childiae]|uniref:Ankyrin repeat domain-containing protein 50 n=1 Tax=Daldinia childiae TaxID=326645 RepID=UPI0014471E7E|nr:Ankyrin repeat domain-containing protein 50 [Daldinia childiae]KAF3054827.1 Ankyrin repeat domain-containing protein 50 [Daldinia childiae]
MASQASVASSQPDPRQLRLIAAAAQANEARLRDILAEDPWTSSNDQDALRQSLQKAAARGKLSIIQLLLEYGAEVNSKRENEIPALVKAAEGGHADIVAELLKHNADPNGRNRNAQTALFSACLKGFNKVVETLLEGRANVEAQDKEGRSPLLFLASEKPGKGKWTIDTLKLLLNNGANLEVKDQIGRTPLLWAATNGNVELAHILLEMGADIAATNNRGRTALHLAAESHHKEQHQDMVKLLLNYGATPRAVSDGGWTPLHNAAQSGYAPVVTLLLEANADINAELSNGMTPLHWAAFNGFEEIVQLLLTRPDVDLSIKDSFNRTAMLCAAEKNHPEIVQLLSPARAADRLSPIARRACQAFEATVVDFGQFEKKQLVSKYSVYDLLYGWDSENDKPKIPTLTKNIKYKPDFRWIHLPANNIDWVEVLDFSLMWYFNRLTLQQTLLAKSFIEAGHRDIEAFKALEKCFDQEHRGELPHAHFMRTNSHRITAHRVGFQDKREDKSTLAPLSEEPSEVSTRSSQSGDSSPKQNDYFEDDMPSKKKGKSEQIMERHPKKHKRAKGAPGNPSHRQDSTTSNLSSKSQVPLAWGTPGFAPSNGKIVLFMPFLHYETDERRQKMSNAIKNAHEKRRLVDTSRDSLIINAYLHNNPPLHPRRTLDQFFYHGIDTSARDTDQVVYRYCKRYLLEPKVFMVDQLWLWVIGKDDLAMLITSRCSGTFDRHRLDDQDFQFLDMFENSIGVVTDRESQLFSRFNRASAQSARWLQYHRRQRSIGRPARLSSFGTSDPYEGNSADQFPDALLDIGVETSLLAEIKDIRDELSIIAVLLDSQVAALADFEDQVTEELRSEGPNRRATDNVVAEIRKRSREQLRGLEVRQKDVWRMDQQAASLYDNLTDLLDLKQKHSNALEARFAGDQAVIAARQGQTIMVFTIVTIIFLPMSFIAAFFAINLQEWQEGTALTIPYVSKYMFGIGLGVSVPLIAMAFTVTDISDAAKDIFGAGKRWLSKRKRRLLIGEEKRDEDVVPEQETYVPPTSSISLSHRERGGLGREIQTDGLSARTRPRHSRERSDEYGYYAAARLSPSSGRRGSGAPRKVSFGDANGNGHATGAPWTRPSLDRSRGRLSEDLEKGRYAYG